MWVTPAANAVSGFTRAWIMGQGHCRRDRRRELDYPEHDTAHAARYSLTEEGLRRICQISIPMN
jgi:hypothetical protein